jgi:hypothetical protein
VIRILNPLFPTFALGVALAAQNAAPPSTPPLVPAAAIPCEGSRCRASELAAHPWHAGGLELLIQKFGGPLIGSGDGLLWMSVRVENKSAESRPFALDQLIAVGNDGTQALLALSGHGNFPIFTSVKTQIAPGAHLTLPDCQLSAPVVLPVRIYYGGRLLVEVTGR